MDRLGILITDNIKRLLEEKELSQKALARLLGKSEGWVSNKLREHRKITVEYLEIIASALEVEWTDLLPRKLSYDINKMSVLELLRTICRGEIEKYLKENGIVSKPNEP